MGVVPAERAVDWSRRREMLVAAALSALKAPAVEASRREAELSTLVLDALRAGFVHEVELEIKAMFHALDVSRRAPDAADRLLALFGRVFQRIRHHEPRRAASPDRATLRRIQRLLGRE